MSSSHSSQCVLVTGATGGVGRAVALAAADAYSSHLWLTGRRESALMALHDKIGDRGSIIAGDLALPDFRSRLADEVLRSSEGLELLVHTAGVYSALGMSELTRQEYERVLDVNLFARFDLTRRLLPILQRSGGVVVFVNSSVAVRAGVGPSLYAASMHAARAGTDGLRNELSAAGIRVLNVFLGRTATPMQERIHQLEGRRYEPERLIQPSTVAQAILSMSLLPTDAEVTDLWIRPALPPRA